MNKKEALIVMIRDGDAVVCETGFRVKFQNFRLFYYASDDGCWRSCGLGNMPDKKYSIYKEPIEFTIKPFDKVLVRNQNDHQWYCNFFSHIDDSYFYCPDTGYNQIAPYEGNEPKVGTKEDILNQWTREEE